MATGAPPEVTLDNLSGKFVMNKSLSSNPEPALAMQGIGWLLRKGIGLASVTLHVKQYTDDQGKVHIDIDQTATGGIKGTSEKRTVDGLPRPHEDYLFGKLMGRSRWCTMAEVGDGAEQAHLADEDRQFLTTGWGDEFGSPDVRVLENFVVNEQAGWCAWAIWGFDVLGDDKKRRFVRHTVIRSTKTTESHHVMLVFDWAGN